MSGWDTLNKVAGGTTTKQSSGWDSLNASVKPSKTAVLAKENLLSQQEAQKQSSIGTLAKETLLGLPQASGIPQAFNAGVSQVKSGYGQLTSPSSSLLQRGEGLLNLGAGAINTAFSPLAPVFSPVGKAVDYAGDKLSNTSYLQGYGRDVANLPPEQTNTPERILNDVINASTVASALGPKFAKKSPSVIPVTGSSEIGTVPVTKNIPVHSTVSRETPINIQTPYLSPKETPVIDFGSGKRIQASEQLPTIDYSSLSKKKPVLAKSDSLKMQEPYTQSKLEVKEQPKTSNRPLLKPFEGTGKVKTRGLAKGIEAKAIEKGITSGFESLPEYKQVNFKDQAQKIASLINKDYEVAKSIAYGEKSAPKGIIPEMVLKAVEDRAILEGDAETIHRLGTSGLTQEGTTMGQRIRALGERNPESPTYTIQELQKTREEAAQRRHGDLPKVRKETLAEIKTHIKKLTPTKETWASFVDSVTC